MIRAQLRDLSDRSAGPDRGAARRDDSEASIARDRRGDAAAMIALLAAILSRHPGSRRRAREPSERHGDRSHRSGDGNASGTYARYRCAAPRHFSPARTSTRCSIASSPPATLQQAIAAAPFAPGLPDSGGAVPVELGGTLPAGHARRPKRCDRSARSRLSRTRRCCSRSSSRAAPTGRSARRSAQSSHICSRISMPARFRARRDHARSAVRFARGAARVRRRVRRRAAELDAAHRHRIDDPASAQRSSRSARCA